MARADRAQRESRHFRGGQTPVPVVDKLPADQIPPPPPLADSPQPGRSCCQGVVRVGGAAGAALLLALVLAPGLAYRVGRERRLPERKRRGSRGQRFAVGGRCNLDSLGPLGFRCAEGPDADPYARCGRADRRSRRLRRSALAVCGRLATGIYAVAFALAATEGCFGFLARLTALLGLGGRRRGISHESAWWLAFKPDHVEELGDDPPTGGATFVWCALTDGDYLGGQLRFFNSDTTENLDRDLLLRSPIRYLAAASNGTRPSQPIELTHVSSAVISASRIRYLTVSHCPSRRQMRVGWNEALRARSSHRSQARVRRPSGGAHSRDRPSCAPASAQDLVACLPMDLTRDPIWAVVE